MVKIKIENMAGKLPPKYSASELIRFPLIFGTFILTAGTAFYFRKYLIPPSTVDQRSMVRGSEEDRELLKEAIKKSFR